MTRTKKHIARAAAALSATAALSLVVVGTASAGYLNGCNVPQSTLYAAADMAQGFGSAYCAGNVSQMEVEVDLYEYWITAPVGWHLEATTTAGPTSVGSGKTLKAPPATATCNTTQSRDWKVITTGYGDIGGTWYTDQDQVEENLDCRN